MKITNKDPGFYDLLGTIFGSRKVHRETGDRFFDDDKKEWYLEVNDEKEILALISLSGETIKNVYCQSQESLVKLLKDVYYSTGSSTVPSVYLDAYKKAGYSIEESELKKFVKIQGGVFNGGIFL